VQGAGRKAQGAGRRAQGLATLVKNVKGARRINLKEQTVNAVFTGKTYWKRKLL